LDWFVDRFFFPLKKRVDSLQGALSFYFDFPLSRLHAIARLSLSDLVFLVPLKRLFGLVILILRLSVRRTATIILLRRRARSLSLRKQKSHRRCYHSSCLDHLSCYFDIERINLQEIDTMAPAQQHAQPENASSTHTQSQRYLSTRGEDSGV
jgi:hypothetical protein